MKIFNRHAATVIAGAVLSAAFLTPAEAAIRRCHASVSSEVARAATEIEARRLALAEWRRKAEALGAEFAAWRLAYNKALQCFEVGGQFECIALGQPCTIAQNPKRTVPDRGGKDQPL